MKNGDIVLVRDHDTDHWIAVKCIDNEENIAQVLDGSAFFLQMIPFKGNENLLGTKKPAPAVPKDGEYWLCRIDDKRMKEYSFNFNKLVLYYNESTETWHLHQHAMPPFVDTIFVIPIKKIE